ncbi:unnamed protein product, partial [Owenia fusiformis]
ICTLDYTPVCGYDGTKYKTYGNRCALDAAICESEGKARFIAPGECPSADDTAVEFTCKVGAPLLRNPESGETIFCVTEPEEQGCPDQYYCVNNPLSETLPGFCCPKETIEPVVEPKPNGVVPLELACRNGQPLRDPMGAMMVFCGRGPDRQDCPADHFCNVAADDSYAVCCPLADCGFPDVPSKTDSGTVIVGAACTVFGCVAQYTCNPGFQVDGQTVRTCMDNGKWSGEAPICKPAGNAGKDRTICRQPKFPGDCRGYFPRWYYDSQASRCQQFIYGGCNANDNNFGSRYDCEEACVNVDVKENESVRPVLIPISGSEEESSNDICSQPKEIGRCRSYFPRWYFNTETKKCEEFGYGGCGANENNFDTIEACIQTCAKTGTKEDLPTINREEYDEINNKPVDEIEQARRPNEEFPGVGESNVNLSKPDLDPCSLPKLPGKCKGYFERWYFDANTFTCKMFVYGGCGANGNNFESLGACRQTCNPIRDSKEVLPALSWEELIEINKLEKELFPDQTLGSKPDLGSEPDLESDGASEPNLSIPQGIPSVILVPTEQNVMEGTPASFLCQSPSNHNPNISWLRNGRKIGTKSGYIIQEMPFGSVLRIEFTRAADREFTCVDDDLPEDEAAKAVGTLTVYKFQEGAPTGYPRITVHPRLKAVEKGQSTVMTCNADGYPEPTISWFKNLVPVDMTDPRFTLLSTGHIQITEVESEDQGKYECSASNEKGISYSQPAVLYVRVRRVPPYFTIKPVDVRVEKGGDVSIDCVASGSPMPYVKWFKGDIQLTPEFEVQLGRNVLTMTDAQEDATVRCVAESELGRAEANARITILKGTKEDLPDITWEAYDRINSQPLPEQARQPIVRRPDVGSNGASAPDLSVPEQSGAVFANTPTKITGIVGRSVVLPCTIHSHAKHQVMWLNRYNVVLTVGNRRIIDDPRISVQQEGDKWDLKISGLD